MEQTRILDGRRWRGEYEADLMRWFQHELVDTRCVLVDTIDQRTVTNRAGKVIGYRVRWKEAIIGKDGEYERTRDGYLKTIVRARRTKVPAVR